MKLSQLFGKRTRTLDGKKRGYIVGITHVDRQIEGIICADEHEKTFYLNFKNVLQNYGTEDDFLVAEYDKDFKVKGESLRLGIIVISSSGKFLGNLNELEYEKNELTYAYVDNKHYLVDGAIISDVMILQTKVVKSDVISDGTIVLKKGTPLTANSIYTAISVGEYIQTMLKSF